jgi:hypothetical protein
MVRIFSFGERWNVPFNSAVASLNGTFHLSSHENILNIALINIHYLYKKPLITYIGGIGAEKKQKTVKSDFYNQKLNQMRKIIFIQQFNFVHHPKSVYMVTYLNVNIDAKVINEKN